MVINKVIEILVSICIHICRYVCVCIHINTRISYIYKCTTFRLLAKNCLGAFFICVLLSPTRAQRITRNFDVFLQAPLLAENRQIRLSISYTYGHSLQRSFLTVQFNRF